MVSAEKGKTRVGKRKRGLSKSGIYFIFTTVLSHRFPLLVVVVFLQYFFSCVDIVIQLFFFFI